jgi:hypothetical protein
MQLEELTASFAQQGSFRILLDRPSVQIVQLDYFRIHRLSHFVTNATSLVSVHLDLPAAKIVTIAMDCGKTLLKAHLVVQYVLQVHT